MANHHQMYKFVMRYLPQSTLQKYLGVIEADDLEWDEHVNSAANKVNSMLLLIARNLRKCPGYSKSLAYTILVRPRMKYYFTVWDPYKQCNKDILKRVNRRAACVESWCEQDVM